MSTFIELLRYLDTTINRMIDELAAGITVSSIVLLVIISFVYGVVHSLGPGHGKSLVATFFFKEKHPLKKSVELAAIISIIHTGAAVILSFLLFFVLTGIKGMMRIRMQGYFIAVSGVLVAIAGIVFLLMNIFSKKKEESGPAGRNTGIVAIGISAGIIPCPAALMIMLLTLSGRIPAIGLASVVSMSLGMFFLLSAIGFISIKSRNGIISISDLSVKKSELVSTVLEYISIILIIIIGVAMSLPFIRLI